jgi:MFS transporter, DHA2 family, multidrug resistance protein
MSNAAVPLLHEDPLVHRRRWLVLGVMCLSLVLVVMAVSSLNVAVPSMQAHLGATAGELHWIVDAYAIAFAGFLLPAGALGDRFGRKGALLVGLAVFGLGLLLAGVGDTPTQVIVGRAVMGVGAAFVMPATLSLITAVFPPEERTKAIATWAGFAGAGGAIGPIVAGLVLESFWWGAVLLANLPLVVVSAIVIGRVAPRSRESEATPLDPAGSLLSLLGMVALLFGIIEGAERGWTDVTVVGSFVASAVLLVGFVVWEARSRHPMLPVRLFADRRLSVGSAVVTLVFFVMFAFFFLVTQYLQYVRGYTALHAAVSMLPLPIALVVVSPRSAGLAERFGVARVMAAGFVSVALGLAVFSQVGNGSSYLLIAAGFVFTGVGLGAAAAPATGLIMSAVPLDKAGVGSAVNDTTRELGAALGVAVFGSLAGSLYRSGVDLEGQELPAELADVAGESMGGAWSVASELPSGAGTVLVEAQSAFTSAFQATAVVSTVVALAAAGLVLTTLGGARAGGGPGGGGVGAPGADPEVDGRAVAPDAPEPEPVPVS